MPDDPAYTLTKHAVVGFVRGAAEATTERGIRINALCPGFTDTPIVAAELLDRLPAELMQPAFVAEAALMGRAAESRRALSLPRRPGATLSHGRR
jgi:NAD(P)-dependent dehydrogenase (short-subunit alcohol dehydrogenase family)